MIFLTFTFKFPQCPHIWLLQKYKWFFFFFYCEPYSHSIPKIMQIPKNFNSYIISLSIQAITFFISWIISCCKKKNKYVNKNIIGRNCEGKMNLRHSDELSVTMRYDFVRNSALTSVVPKKKTNCGIHY